MLTLCTMALLEEAANLAHDYTGGFDGLDSSADHAGARHVRVQSALSEDAVPLRPLGALRLLRVRAHARLFAVRPEPDGNSREHALRMHAVGARRAPAARSLLRHLGGHRRRGRRRLGAGQRLREPRHSGPRPRGHRADHSGPRRLRPACTARSSARSPTWRCRTFSRRSIPRRGSSDFGLLLVVIALFARNGILGIIEAAARRLRAAPRATSRRTPFSRRARCAGTSARWPPRVTSTSGSRPAPATR